MSQPTRRLSHDRSTQTGPGDSVVTRAHPQMGLFTVVEGVSDIGNVDIELRLEGSPDDVVYAPLDRAAPNVADVFFTNTANLSDTGETDGNGDAIYANYVASHNQPIEFVRANVITNANAHPITTHIFLSGWTQRGASFDHLNPDE